MLTDIPAILFWLKKLLAQLMLPPLAPLLLILIGLLLLRRWRPAGLSLAWIGLALAIFTTSPATVGWLLGPLEATPPIGIPEARQAQAIVILGGGRRSYAPEYGGETVGRLTLERVRFGARIARESGLPVLLTGGLPGDGLAEADLMHDALENDFGIAPRWIERASRNTRENAAFSAVHLEAAGVTRIVLVTHAVHMPRAAAEFETHGFEVIRAPTGWFGNREPSDDLPSLLPSANSAFAGWLATHEWLGRLAYRLGV